MIGFVPGTIPSPERLAQGWNDRHYGAMGEADDVHARCLYGVD
jgi:hypothetical protein